MRSVSACGFSVNSLSDYVPDVIVVILSLYWPYSVIRWDKCARLLVDKISSPTADTSRATTSLCAAIEDLKAISGPSLGPLIGRPLAPNSHVEKQNFFPLKAKRSHLEDFP